MELKQLQETKHRREDNEGGKWWYDHVPNFTGFILWYPLWTFKIIVYIIYGTNWFENGEIQAHAGFEKVRHFPRIFSYR